MRRVTTAAFAIKAFLEGTRTYAPSVVEMTCGGAFLVAIDARERLVASTRLSEDWPVNSRNLLQCVSSPLKAVRRGSTVDSGRDSQPSSVADV